MASPMARAEAVLARKCLVIGLVRVKVGWKCRFPFVGGQSRTSRREELEKRIALEKFDKFCGIDQVRGDPARILLLARGQAPTAFANQPGFRASGRLEYGGPHPQQRPDLTRPGAY